MGYGMANDTIVNVNGKLAEGNRERAQGAYVKRCRAYLASEIAYAAATGCDRLTVPMSYAIEYESLVQWRVDMDDDTAINASMGHAREELGDAFASDDELGIVRWLADKAGVANASVRIFDDGFNVSDVNLIVDGDMVADPAIGEDVGNDGMSLVLSW